MQIKKGTISYQGLNDWECLYGEVERDGKLVQYYFMDNSSLPNGNFIASTQLVEAIDREVQTQHIGMIDSEGDIILPFEHKSIKVIPGEILLVEKTQPVSESVLEALELRKDPLCATKLVSTPAAIKEKLNIQMGVDGRYLFNDQFSEASIFDFNGKNLINDEYYSFIGIANGKLYLTKNTIDAPITEFSIFPAEVRDENVSEENAIDIKEVADNHEEIGQAIEGEVEKQEQEISNSIEEETPVVDANIEKNEETSVAVDKEEIDINNTNVDITSETDDNSGDEPAEEKNQDSEGVPGMVSVVGIAPEISEDNINNSESESQTEEVTNEEQNDNVNEEETIVPVINIQASDETEETSTEEEVSVEESKEKVDNSEEEIDISVTQTDDETSDVSTDGDSENEEEEKELNDSDVFGESILKADSIEGDDDFNLNNSEENIMDKVMVSLSDLIEDGKKKQEVIENKDAENKSLLNEIEGLKTDLDDKDKRLMDVEKELADLKAKTQANDKLLQLLNDANKLLGKDSFESIEKENVKE